MLDDKIELQMLATLLRFDEGRDFFVRLRLWMGCGLHYMKIASGSSAEVIGGRTIRLLECIMSVPVSEAKTKKNLALKKDFACLLIGAQ